MALSPTRPAVETEFAPASVIRRDGVAVVVRHPADAPPIVQHWGADLGPLDPDDLLALTDADERQTRPGTLDAAWRPGVLPTEPDGWPGRPGLLLVRAGVPLVPRWQAVDVTVTDHAMVSEVADAEAGLVLTTRLHLEPGGLLGVKHTLTAEHEPVEVHWLEAVLPVPTRADDVTTFSGRWTREKAPQTSPLGRGSLARQTRRGRPGHDQPWLLALSEGTAKARTGEVWAVHLAWSADVTYRTDRLPDNPTLLGAGELLRPGEIVLGAGESYSSPTAWFAWSPAGLDGVSAKFHTYLRSRPHHPGTPRPLVLNTWEAVYFNHDPATVERLAERAAAIGVERFVLDDGWFLARRDDTRGLGDWEVDRSVWPEGLQPLAERVRALGMQFGLWFEPEMVSLDSDLARAHPDWLLHDAAQVPSPADLSWRTQFVLDLARPGAYEHVLNQMSTLVADLGLAFIKWDHNRDLVDARHEGRPGVHAQTLGALRLMAELKARHPGLEIESCSSGGARSDLGVLEVADRVWASDSNDALERQDIQRWTELLLPPELIGAHVGPPTAHSSGRTLDLSYRLATSLTGSSGFEWDILQCDDQETEQLRRFGELYRELRGLLHSGTVVHGDVRDPALRVRGVVANDLSAGVWTVATVASLEDARPEPVRLQGLAPERRYRVRVREEVGQARWGWITPGWLSKGEVVLPGKVLETVGLQLPALWPQQALVLHATAV
ncbi:alpha-galactosidase [Kineosporia sp. NBRC 101677]|uniref:alpha-galactosidase n=1 Tax=Kineosporia sp. NBRC 101677 TaxID=3032197 RepID=UPI0024A10842|nr:alpha-galactosidase [Kineosporia sp. NBRC 101677]GLY15414.1 alpha-galactosidase [Kineosporia sp. NBRC 101677]